MTAVLDASAVIAWLHAEPGAETVSRLLRGGRVSAANWSEILVAVRRTGRPVPPVVRRTQGRGVSVEPVTTEDARLAAELWSPNSGLSLGDRLCLALGIRLGGPVVTADRRWAELPLPAEVVVIR